MTQMPFDASVAYPTAPGAGRRARMRGPWSITYGQCTTGWDWCATDVMIACTQWPALSATMADRTVTNPGKEISMSQPHQSNQQRKQNHHKSGSKQGGQDGMVYTRLSYWEYPYLSLQPWRRTTG